MIAYDPTGFVKCFTFFSPNFIVARISLSWVPGKVLYEKTISRFLEVHLDISSKDKFSGIEKINHTAKNITFAFNTFMYAPWIIESKTLNYALFFCKSQASAAHQKPLCIIYHSWKS